MTEVCIIMGRKHDGEAAQVYCWLHNLILSLRLERWANICKAWVLVWAFWAEARVCGKTENCLPALLFRVPRAIRCAVEWWDFPLPLLLTFFLAFPGLAAKWSQVNRGDLWECNSSWQKTKRFWHTSCAGDMEKKSLIVANIFNLEISAPEEPPTSYSQGQSIYTLLGPYWLRGRN